MEQLLRTILAAAASLGHGVQVAVGAPLRRVLAIADAGVNLGCAAGLALLALAQPAFRETGPDWLRRLDLSVTFLDRSGEVIGHRGIRHDDRPGLADLPPHLVSAVLATEDRRFYTHWGVDPLGLARALAANVEADGVVQGGSTLTQQLAKNLFLTSERTLDRKIKEAFLAVWLEFRLTKDEILKLYLDRAYMGAGTFGIEAAAQFYFGTSARDVTLPEAAMLAGLFKAPSRYGPHAAPAAAEARAAEVLDRMEAAGLLDRVARDDAKRRPARAIPREVRPHPDHYLDFAFRQVQRLAAAGRLGGDPVLVVDTPLDSALQARAETVLRATLARDGARLKVGEAAMVVMDPAGGIRAMVGGRNYEASQFNRATDALRQPGSAFKPIVYAAALAHTDLRPTSLVRDAEICIGAWCPANYSRGFSGTVPLAAALASSLNTVAVRLSVEIGRVAGEMTIARQARFGRARIIELARDLGLRTPMHDTPSLPLGASEVTVLDLATAYAAFPGGGIRAEPHAVVRIRTARGAPVYVRERDEPAPPRVLGPALVGDMNLMLRRVVEAGTADRAAIPGHVVAGKTGTTSAYRDAWFAGFTGHLVGALWLGNDDYSPTRQITGGNLAAATWQEVMSFAHRDLAPVPLPDGGGATRVAGGGRGVITEVGPAAGAGQGRGFEVVSGARGRISAGR